jgi:MYXO-CTERM domain-containing protein
MKVQWLAGCAAPVVMASLHVGLARADTRPLAPLRATQYPPGAHYVPLCPEPDAQGRRCYGQVLVDALGQQIKAATAPQGGWTPSELAAAYALPSTGGEGKTIALYIGSHYTNAESDVAAYRSMFGLAPCTSASGCFTQITDSGSTDFSGLNDDGCSGFVGEEALDVDMLMAGCPNCKVLIIEGGNHPAALATAKQYGALSISMSWGYQASASDCDDAWVPPAGLSLFGASGDTGYTANPGSPSACKDVVAVGWTQLATDTSSRGYADTLPAGWGSAGGCDPLITKPSWEADPSCSNRMVSDMAANGDDVASYCTSPSGSANWHVTGGSSAATPFTSAVLAHLGITGGGFGPAWLYANASKFWDVTSGGPVQNCPSGSPDYYCNALTGYDGPTGVGTPYAPPFLGTGAVCTTPSGSYLQSCTGCAAVSNKTGCGLTCLSCTKIDQSENPNPSLSLPCTGTISNLDGVLSCVGGTSVDAGSAPSDGGGEASLEDAGSQGSPDATTAGDGASAMDEASVVPAPDAATDEDGSTEGGAPVAEAGQPTKTGNSAAPHGSSGCGCTQAGSDGSPAYGLAGIGIVLATALRRRRRQWGGS